MWLHVPSTSLASARAVPVSIEDSISLCRQVAPCVGLNGKPSPPSSWRRAWTKDRFIKRLFGRIYEPSTAARGVASWMESLRATRANRSASRANDLAKMIRDTFGLTSLASLKRLNPASCFVRTSPDISASVPRKSSPTFTEWASALRLASSVRRKWVQRLTGRDSSFLLWPIARAASAMCRKKLRPLSSILKHCASRGRKRSGNLEDEVVTFRYGLLAQKSSTNGGRSSPAMQDSYLQLNPKFVEWLMGWPAISSCSATASFLLVRRMRSHLSSLLSKTNQPTTAESI